jgi:hypothetical protein
MSEVFDQSPDPDNFPLFSEGQMLEDGPYDEMGDTAVDVYAAPLFVSEEPHFTTHRPDPSHAFREGPNGELKITPLMQRHDPEDM